MFRLNLGNPSNTLPVVGQLVDERHQQEAETGCCRYRVSRSTTKCWKGNQLYPNQMIEIDVDIFKPTNILFAFFGTGATTVTIFCPLNGVVTTSSALTQISSEWKVVVAGNRALVLISKHG
ncbi:hypothetical protein PMIN06_012762 [Paraphaeosphaeria minitans]